MLFNLIRRRQEVGKGRQIIAEKVKIKERPNYHQKKSKDKEYHGNQFTTRTFSVL